MTTETTTLSTRRCIVETEKASRYLQQLCKHFQHKIPAEFDTEQGKITFPMGVCTLKAEGTVLTMDVTAADSAALDRLQDVVGSHFIRFAFREPQNDLIWQTI